MEQKEQLTKMGEEEKQLLAREEQEEAVDRYIPYTYLHYDARREIDYVIYVDEKGRYKKEIVEQYIEPEDYADEDLENYDKWEELLLYYLSKIAEEEAIHKVEIDFYGDSMSASIICKLEHMAKGYIELQGDLFNDICKNFRILDFSAGRDGDTFSVEMEVENKHNYGKNNSSSKS